MSFAFAGTPRFASLVLRELVELGRAPSIVISQPDKPTGRGRTGRAPHAVGEAMCHGLDCLQTDNINSQSVADQLRCRGIDTVVVAAFGQLLSKSLLESFTCVNIHASLLPRHRGAAPIERALMAGDETTGVTIMRITEGLDEGPWADKVAVSIGMRQDAGSLLRVLAVTGAVALVGVLDGIQDGTVRWAEQTGDSSYAHKLSTDDHWLSVEGGARRAHDQIRALSPMSGARAVLGGTEVKIWRSWPHGEPGLDQVPDPAMSVKGQAGRVLATEGRLFVGCNRGCIEVLEIQPVSRSRMSAGAFLRGYAGRIGERMAPSCSARPTDQA